MSQDPGWAAPGSDAVGSAPPPGGPEPHTGSRPDVAGSGGSSGGGLGWPTTAPPFGQPAPALQPGVVPLRPLGLGELLDGAVTTIRRYPRVTLGYATLFAVLGQGSSLALSALSGRLSTRLPTRGSPFAALSSLTSGPAVLAVLLSSFADLVLTGFVAVIVSEAVLGRRIGAQAVWRRIRPLTFPLLVVSALVAVVPSVGLTLLGTAPILGVLLLLVPGVLLWGAWSLAVPALVLERAGIGGALRRSWRLAVPDWGRVWLVRSLSWLLAGVLSSLVGAVFGAVAFVSVFQSALHGGSTVAISPLGLTLVAVGSVLASILTGPFLAGVLSLLYIDRRIRAEALDVALQESVRGAARPGSALPAAGAP
ncbi:MAG: hypothetical protein M3Z02_05760 [Actinomycetota bacterium]|nr:hypothetical protein [Actinomycetota bacterium]